MTHCWIALQGVPMNSLRFLFEGQRIADNQTPKEVGLFPSFPLRDFHLHPFIWPSLLFKADPNEAGDVWAKWLKSQEPNISVYRFKYIIRVKRTHFNISQKLLHVQDHSDVSDAIGQVLLQLNKLKVQEYN